MLIIEYFHNATPEFLHGLGVDPTKLPSREIWRAHYDRDFALPVEQRRSFLVLWTLDAAPIGFSTADKIVIGEQAFMHLHIFDSGRRGSRATAPRWCGRPRNSISTRCASEQLYCEPYALNVAPNRTLQKAGFATTS